MLTGRRNNSLVPLQMREDMLQVLNNQYIVLEAAGREECGAI
jgi:hypothetical protein